MHVITYTEARQNLAKTMNRVNEDFESVLITRSQNESCVLMSLKEYESLQETAYLLRSPANAKRLLESIQQIYSGKISMRELVE